MLRSFNLTEWASPRVFLVQSENARLGMYAPISAFLLKNDVQCVEQVREQILEAREQQKSREKKKCPPGSAELQPIRGPIRESAQYNIGQRIDIC